MAVIQRLLSERGFQIARGTYHHGNGDTLSTVVITRRDTPEWSGEWAPWDPEPDGEGEVQCALFLCGLACAKWDRDAWMFLPNTQFRDAGGQSPALRTDDQPNSL